MKKNEFYEGMVTSLKFPNKGIVYVEDEDAYVQVKNTLPGQRVRFQLKKVKNITGTRGQSRNLEDIPC